MMNKEIDKVIKWDRYQEDVYLKIAYRYKFYEYLVADKFGNLFILPHCPEKRTIKFNQLSVFENNKHLPKAKRTKSIKYHNSIISFKQLKDCVFKVNELFLIPLNYNYG